jgi:type IV pilus assembly protein PilW
MDRHTRMPSARRQGGFTLVELMVTVAIAMFLLAGLVTIVQNIRGSYFNQQQIVQLQDEQRFALTVMTDAVQAAGYFPNPAVDTTLNFGATAPFPAAGWVFAGTHAAGLPDQLSTRFMSGPLPDGTPAYGPVLCDGTDTSGLAANTWAVTFSVDTVKNQLQCSVNGGPQIPLVGGVTGLTVYYGVKRNTVPVDYNVDTYETWDVLLASGTDWQNISAVRVIITFQNPLFPQASQPQFVTVERVIQVMGRGGMHT